MLIAFMVLGIAGIVLFALAWRSNRKLFAEAGELAPSRATRRVAWVVAAGLVAASPFFSYPYREGERSWRVVGFPLPVAVFDAAGADYVGPTTVPALIGNAAFFALLPQAVLWIVMRRRTRGAPRPVREPEDTEIG